MVCVPACLAQGAISHLVTILHPIPCDGDEGFFLPSTSPATRIDPIDPAMSCTCNTKGTCV